jgi:hypothetical protein
VSTVSDTHETAQPDALSRCLILLLKGVLYRDDDPATWSALHRHQAQAREHLALLGLDLLVDDAEGWAFVRSRPSTDDRVAAPLPRLVTRRELSFPVSLLLALLRRKLAEFDARGGDTRLVLARSEIIELLRTFLPERADEARLFAQIDAHVNKVVDLGFLRRLASAPSAEPHFEVRRIIKAFVDAQWLTDFDAHLAAYREALDRDLGGPDEV